jgi:hypothetical protein
MAPGVADAPDAGAGTGVGAGAGDVASRASAEARCRNCGAVAPHAYCPACGQETSLALPTARQFLKDAAGRYVAFDGRMWRTLAMLMFRPGLLTLEYFAGRRRRYIRPARLFLVLSVLLFFVIRVTVGVPQIDEAAFQIDVPGPAAGAGGEAPASPAGGADRPGAAAGARPSGSESARVLLPGMGFAIDPLGNVSVEGSGVVARAVKQRMERFNALPKQERVEQLVLGTLRYGPYAMFVLLPAFALLLMVVYAGPRARYPRRPRRYAEHLVFAAHNHAFLFLAVTLAVLLPVGLGRLALGVWAAIYGLWSLRNVYGGRWLGLVARAWLLSIAYLVLFAFATAGLVIAAIVIR